MGITDATLFFLTVLLGKHILTILPKILVYLFEVECLESIRPTKIKYNPLEYGVCKYSLKPWRSISISNALSPQQRLVKTEQHLIDLENVVFAASYVILDYHIEFSAM